MMTTEQKLEIQALLAQHVGRHRSQSQAVKVLRAVSEATVIAIRQGKWENISEEMWRNVGKQVGHTAQGGWQTADTRDHRTLAAYLADAQRYGNVFAVAAPAGTGKSHTAARYAAATPHAYHLTCAEYMSRKVFLQKLLACMGRPADGTVSEMMDAVMDHLRRVESPLLILDEADKLPDASLYFFITLYNEVRGRAGVVLMATEYLARRIDQGRRAGRRGYAEIYSRIGSRYIGLKGASRQEVAAICAANELADPTEVARICNEFAGDLRRVERAVHRHRLTTGTAGTARTGAARPDTAQKPLETAEDEAAHA